MIPEQAVIKAGDSEIPLIAFDSLGFWGFLLLCFLLAGLWIWRRA